MKRSLSSWLTVTFVMALLLGGSPALNAQDETREILSDDTIRQRVESQLLTDPGTQLVGVDVKSEGGVITLDGQVATILASDRASRIVQTVKGVQAVVNQLEVKAISGLDDSKLQKRIIRALEQNPVTEAYDVNVSVDDGSVMVRGQVQSYREKEIVLRVIKRVIGVQKVEEELEVDVVDDRSDSELLAEIKAVLRWNPHIDETLIEVSVEDGKVTLSGNVGTVAEKVQARSAVWVPGVKAVDAMDVDIKQWANNEDVRERRYVDKSSEQLMEDARHALRLDPRVYKFDIDISIAGSAATLSGEVDNMQAKIAAAEDVENVVGIRSVTNNVEVKSSENLSDSRIDKDVIIALAEDPYVESYEFRTDVKDGVVTLTGTVDSRFERNWAEYVTAGVRGVEEVDNGLRVRSQKGHNEDPYVTNRMVDKSTMIQYEKRAPLVTDAQLKRSIKDEFWWSPFVDSNQVEVSVDNAIATLSGQVSNYSARKAATENAYEAGATLVENNIEVTPSLDVLDSDESSDQE